MKRFLIYSFLILIVVQLLSLTIPPFGILLGTTFILPLAIWLIGEKNKIHGKKIIYTILIFYLISRTLDWYIAPGTHDHSGIGWMFVMSLFATSTIFFIWIVNENKSNFKKIKTYIILIFIFSLPYIQMEILFKYFNQHLNETKKDLFEYINYLTFS